MKRKLLNLIAGLLMYLPANQRLWTHCMEQYYPILAPAFPNDPFLLMQALQTMQSIDEGNLGSAQKILRNMYQPCMDGSREDQALFYVLRGLYAQKREDYDTMARCFQSAHNCGHHYHLPHMLQGEYWLEQHYYDRSASWFLAGVDDLYAFPPMTEEMQQVTGQAYAAAALAQTMMHQYDEAAHSLRCARKLNSESAFLAASEAMLYAVNGQSNASHSALSALKKLDAALHAHTVEHVHLLLAGEHPHFTVVPVTDEAGMAAFWQWFCDSEAQLRAMLDEGRQPEAQTLLREHLRQMDDRITIDFYKVRLSIIKGEYVLELYSAHSRTYEAYISALSAARPAHLEKTWRFITGT